MSKPKKIKGPGIRREIATTADIIADDIRRLGHVNGEYRQDWAAARIQNHLEIYEDLIRRIAAKSEPTPEFSGLTDWRAAEDRHEGIRTRTGYGFGCDICNAAGAKAFMTLKIGNYKASLLLDMCRKCAERLSKVVDARLDDRRCRQNRRAAR